MSTHQALLPPPDNRLIFRVLTNRKWDQPETQHEVFMRRQRGGTTEGDLSIICKDNDTNPTCAQIHSIGITKSHGFLAFRASAVTSMTRFPHSNPTGPRLTIQRKGVLQAGVDTPDPFVPTEEEDAWLVAIALVGKVEYVVEQRCVQED